LENDNNEKESLGSLANLITKTMVNKNPGVSHSFCATSGILTLQAD
jgi:hypothetical protein